jgi:hypothetical protein
MAELLCESEGHEMDFSPDRHVRSREDFIALVTDLRENLREHPEDWHNLTLEAFLYALGAWATDMDGYYRGRGEPIPQPDWAFLRDLLLAARVYS